MTLEIGLDFLSLRREESFIIHRQTVPLAIPVESFIIGIAFMGAGYCEFLGYKLIEK